MRLLGQDPCNDLTCVYCGTEAKTWDHLTNLVKGGKFQGFGHQVGNLVPCCKTCNEKKQGKPFREFVNRIIADPAKAEEKVKQLEEYQSRFARKIDLEGMNLEFQPELRRLGEIKEEIFRLMKEADDLSAKVAIKLSQFSEKTEPV